MKTIITRHSLRNILIWSCPFVVGAFLLLYRLADVPGLYRDEGSVGLYAELIQLGLRPVRGYFDFYGAPMNSYIMAACFSLFGNSIWSLRFASVFPIFFGLIFYVDLLRRLCPRHALWALWLLVTLPSFVINGRLAVESNSLTPLFLYGGIWFFYVFGVCRSGWQAALGYTLTGIFFCLGIWNHAMLIPMFVAVSLLYIVYTKMPFRVLLSIAPWIGLGGAIGLIPKLYGVIFLGHPFVPPQVVLLREFTDPVAALLNLIYTLGGDGMYGLVCGQVLVPMNWLVPILLGGATFVVLRRKESEPYRKIWIYIALWALLSAIGTWSIAPGGIMDLRYWANILWLVPILLALAVPAEKRRLGGLLVGAVVFINTGNLAVNYYYNFLEDGGLMKMSDVGGFLDDSGDFVDLRPLIKKVLDHGDGAPIYVDDSFTLDRFTYLFPPAQRSRLNMVSRLNNTPILQLVKGALILLRKRNSDSFYPPQIQIGRHIAKKNEELSTNHYVVFESIN